LPFLLCWIAHFFFSPLMDGRCWFPTLTVFFCALGPLPPCFLCWGDGCLYVFPFLSHRFATGPIMSRFDRVLCLTQKKCYPVVYLPWSFFREILLFPQFRGCSTYSSQSMSLCLDRLFFLRPFFFKPYFLPLISVELIPNLLLLPLPYPPLMVFPLGFARV